MRPTAANALLRPSHEHPFVLVVGRPDSRAPAWRPSRSRARTCARLGERAVHVHESDAHVGPVEARRRDGRLHREAVHHLDRAGRCPGDDADTALPASVVDGTSRRTRASPGAFRMRRTTRSRCRASPSLPTRTPGRSCSRGRRGRVLPSTTDPSARRRAPEHVVRGEPVLEAVGAARVLRHVAPDRADALRRGIGGVVVAQGSEALAHVQVHDAGLDPHERVLEVHGEDALQAREADDDAARDRQRAAREAGTRPARDDGDARLRRGRDAGRHLLGGAGQDDERGGHPVAREAVRGIGAQRGRVRDAMPRADDRGHPPDEFGRDAGPAHGTPAVTSRAAGARCPGTRRLAGAR